MRVSTLLAGSALALAGFSTGLNILMNNDDGFGSGNLRELYKLLKADGHNGKLRPPTLPTREAGPGTDIFKSISSPLPPSRAPRVADQPLPTNPSSSVTPSTASYLLERPPLAPIPTTATSGTTMEHPLLARSWPWTMSCPNLPTFLCPTWLSRAPTTAQTLDHLFGL